MNRYLLMALMLCSGASEAATRWETYLTNPTSQNAAFVSVVSYSQKPEANHDETQSDLRMLEAQVIAQDAASVDLAFRLEKKLDGAVREDVHIMLGRLIRTNPKLFLQTLAAHPAAIESIGYLVGNLGSSYVDRFEAQVYETTKRIEALLSVHDRNLKSVRDRCIVELRQQVKKEQLGQAASKSE